MKIKLPKITKSHRVKITRKLKRLSVVMLIVGAFIAGCKTSNDLGTLVEGHQTIGREAGKAGSKVGRAASEALSTPKTDHVLKRLLGHQAPAERPPACPWEDLGPCSDGPPLAWFGVTDNNANGINDRDE